MVVTMNPFDAGGYSLAEMTEAINILPNVYTRLGQMGLFRFEGVTQRSVVIEQAEGVLNLLPTVPLGGPATVANRNTRSMRSFTGGNSNPRPSCSMSCHAAPMPITPASVVPHQFSGAFTLLPSVA